MNAPPSSVDPRVAVLVDCDNTTPAILEHALRMVAQFGRVVVRRGYGNHSTLTNRWQEALVRLAFTPCLQFPYAAGKNTADISLALDALEVMLDDRAEIFCLVTSDSDFAYLCRKLRERGARVFIVGESKTPDALRNAGDEFFEWIAPAPAAASPGRPQQPSAQISKSCPAAAKAATPVAKPATPAPKRLPNSVVKAVRVLAETAPEGDVQLAMLGNYLKNNNPGFTAKAYGHSSLLKMVRNYDLLVLKDAAGGHCTVRLKSIVEDKA